MHHNTKEQIIEEARRLFSEQGFSETSTEEIARAVGIKKPSLYYFFTNKEDIYFVVLERILTDVNDYFVSSPKSGGVEELTEVILKTLELGRSNGACFVIAANQTCHYRSDHLMSLLEHYIQMKNTIEQRLTDWSVLNPEFAAQVLIDCLQAYLARSFRQEEQLPLDKFARQLAKLIFRFSA